MDFKIATILCCIVPLFAGCQALHQSEKRLQKLDAPNELSKVVLPSYTIEPPDILDIEAIRLVPNRGYLLNTMDVVRVKVRRRNFNRIAPNDKLSVIVPGEPEAAPISGNYQVQPNGLLIFGNSYGSIRVGGLSIEEAKKRIEAQLSTVLTSPKAEVAISETADPVDDEFMISIDGTLDFGIFEIVMIQDQTLAEARSALKRHFSKWFEDPMVTISIVSTSGQQQINGEHLVGPDGNVTLGEYGLISVVGLTVEEVAAHIEARLSTRFDNPQVAVSVYSYNSRFYYVIAQGAGFGDQAFRFPITGNETVLDAITQINGLTEVSSSKMWIARATSGKHRILPVDWQGVSSLGSADTNYQLLPGDRLYIAQDELIAFDRSLEKFISPLERLLGFSILGAETATRLSGKVLKGGGNPRGNNF